MKKKLIRLTEGDLHNIIKECVGKIITEHDPDDPDYGQYGDYYDAQHYVEDCERESGIYYWLNPTTKQIVEDGEETDEDVMFVVCPEFGGGDEYGFDVNGMYFYFDTGDKQKNAMFEKEFGELINKFIEHNADKIYDDIKKNSNYTIY